MDDERAVQQVLARYTRGADRRDGKAVGALFAEEARLEIFTKTGPDAYEPLGEPLVGVAGAEMAIGMLAPHPEGGSSHHLPMDHIIEVDGDHAHMNAQYVVFEVQAKARPADGWPADAFGAQAAIRPIESGYYDIDLRRIDGEWKIVHHRVLLDMPFAIPGVQ